MSGGHADRRSDGFGVRRSLQLGAASAGVSAALFGLSLAGGQVSVALADDSGSPSSDSSSSSSASSTGSRPKTSVGSGRVKDTDTKDTDTEDADTDTAPAESETGTAAAESEPVESSVPTESAPKSSSSVHGDALVVSPAAAPVTTPSQSFVTELAPELVEPAVAEEDSDTTVTAAVPDVPWALQIGGGEDPRKQVIRDRITSWTSESLGWINSLPAPDLLKTHLEGAVWTLRRSMFNLEPTVAPVHVTGQSTGPITGSVGAVDPEGDRIAYRLVTAPTHGSVQINEDGTFTYTPGAGFDGVDSFVVMAQGEGLHVNLFDPIRGGTSSGALVNQGAIKFEFNYTTGSEHWTPERRAALMAAANAAAAYLLVTAPVHLTYDVTGEDDEESSTLASASSELVSRSPGFFYTVVQNKLINGVDSNGEEADGEIDWNFESKWGLGDVVGSDEYDFKAVAMHELMHSFGFSSRVREENTRLHWPVFSSFIVTADGQKPIGSDFKWDTAYDDYLTGANGGLYFGGPNAVAAYGGPVPLYTPNPWKSGAMGHLDDATFTGANEQMMNSRTGKGLSVRVLSPVEIGILKDLGYTVVTPQPSAPAPAAAMMNV